MGCQASHRLQSSSDFKGVKISKYEQALPFMHHMNTCQIQMLSTTTDAQGLSRGIEIAGVCLHKDRETQEFC